MPRKSIILLFLLTAVPLFVFAWLGTRIARSEKARVENRFRAILRERLTDINGTIELHFEKVLRELRKIPEETYKDDRKRREIVRDHPALDAVILLDADGRVVLPNLKKVVTESEFEFLTRIRPVLEDRELVRLSKDENQNVQQQPSSQPSYNRMSLKAVEKAPPAKTSADHGWYVWFWGRGVNLIFWRRLSDGQIGVAALQRARWVADLISGLPNTSLPTTSDVSRESDTRICLVDSNNQTIYQWGNLEPEKSQMPMVELPVVQPLSAWRMKYFRNESPIVSNEFLNSLPIVASIVVVGCGLMGIALVFYREYSRDMREAAQRVNFVNQVSHELKTPLTNIRMYADLLEMDLNQLPEEQNQPLQNRLGIIVSESQRLSRLIGNVLTFARAQRQRVTVRKVDGCVDDVTLAVVKRFRPSLEMAEFRIATDLNAKQMVLLDSDVVEQILGNLISNVERYAADGKYLEIRSEQNQTTTTIVVVDHGPGISAEHAKKVFDPFYRISNQISDTTGTGIGLSIARNLARRHGGDITLVPSSRGSCFQVELETSTK